MVWGAIVFWGVIVGLVIAIIVLLVREKDRPAAASNERLYCPHCGTVGAPEFHMSGSIIVEVLLWLFFLLPGIIYSIWCRSTKRWVCPKCGMTGMIPLDSPLAQKALTTKA